MLEEYDIDKLNPRPNPYAKELKKQITIKISPSVIDYFKGESMETGIPYQTLINLYLADCVKSKRKLEIAWKWLAFWQQIGNRRLEMEETQYNWEKKPAKNAQNLTDIR